jgi:hypothetical protein
VAELSGKIATGPEQLGFGRVGLEPFTPAPAVATPAPSAADAPAAPAAPALAATGKSGSKAGAAAAPPPTPPADPAAEAAAAAAAEAAKAAVKAALEARPWPLVSFRESYLVVSVLGGFRVLCPKQQQKTSESPTWQMQMPCMCRRSRVCRQAQAQAAAAAAGGWADGAVSRVALPRGGAAAPRQPNTPCVRPLLPPARAWVLWGLTLNPSFHFFVPTLLHS